MPRVVAPMCEAECGRMVRLYVRKPGGTGWLAVGWLCLDCEASTLEGPTMAALHPDQTTLEGL